MPSINSRLLSGCSKRAALRNRCHPAIAHNKMPGNSTGRPTPTTQSRMSVVMAIHQDGHTRGGRGRPVLLETLDLVDGDADGPARGNIAVRRPGTFGRPSCCLDSSGGRILHGQGTAVVRRRFPRGGRLMILHHGRHARLAAAALSPPVYSRYSA